MAKNKFIYTNQFSKVFESYDLVNCTAVLKQSELYDEDSMIFIVDEENGNWIYAQGHLLNGSNVTILEKTYQELAELQENGQLITGQLYRMVDYITDVPDDLIVYKSNSESNSGTNGKEEIINGELIPVQEFSDIEDTSYYVTSAKHQFDLILTAINENTLSEDVKAINHIFEDEIETETIKYVLATTESQEILNVAIIGELIDDNTYYFGNSYSVTLTNDFDNLIWSDDMSYGSITIMENMYDSEHDYTLDADTYECEIERYIDEREDYKEQIKFIISSNKTVTIYRIFDENDNLLTSYATYTCQGKVPIKEGTKGGVLIEEEPKEIEENQLDESSLNEIIVFKRTPQFDEYSKGGFAWLRVGSLNNEDDISQFDWSDNTLENSDDIRNILDMCIFTDENIEIDQILDRHGSEVLKAIQVGETNVTRVVTIEDYFANSNLFAWDIKYCFKNDANRFEWAKPERIIPGEVQYIKIKKTYYGYKQTGDEVIPYYYFKRNLNYNPLDDDSFEWLRLNDTSDRELSSITQEEWENDIDNDANYTWLNSTLINGIFQHPFIGAYYDYVENPRIPQGTKYTIVNMLSINDTIIPAGKGVIYYLKDEFNNKCCYDFKNLLFNEYYSFDTVNLANNDEVTDDDPPIEKPIKAGVGKEEPKEPSEPIVIDPSEPIDNEENTNIVHIDTTLTGVSNNNNITYFNTRGKENIIILLPINDIPLTTTVRHNNTIGLSAIELRTLHTFIENGCLVYPYSIGRNNEAYIDNDIIINGDAYIDGSVWMYGSVNEGIDTYTTGKYSHAEGTGTITLHNSEHAQGTYNKSQTIITSDPQPIEYVDLGLPSGLLWATCNLGANTCTELGDRYAFAETETKDEFEWNNYKWGTENNITKYNGDIFVIEPEDDAATVNIGYNWRIATRDEFYELMNYTNGSYIENYEESGVNGVLLTSTENENSIFIPTRHDWGDQVNIWTATPYDTYRSRNFALYFGCASYNTGYIQGGSKYTGMYIRPVHDGFPKKNTIHSTGIGTSDNDRKNAIEIMSNGDIYIIGIGGYDGTNPADSSTLQEIIFATMNPPITTAEDINNMFPENSSDNIG